LIVDRLSEIRISFPVFSTTTKVCEPVVTERNDGCTQASSPVLTLNDRKALAQASRRFEARQRTLCITLLSTGCMLNEALGLTANDVNFGTGEIRFRRVTAAGVERKRIVTAAPELLGLLDWVHNVRQLQAHPRSTGRQPLWPITRMTAWRWLQDIMRSAGIKSEKATLPALRRGRIHDKSGGRWLSVERIMTDDGD